MRRRKGRDANPPVPCLDQISFQGSNNQYQLAFSGTVTKNRCNVIGNMKSTKQMQTIFHKHSVQLGGTTPP